MKVLVDLLMIVNDRQYKKRSVSSWFLNLFHGLESLLHFCQGTAVQ